MISRHVLGKRITQIEQVTYNPHRYGHQRVTSITAIVLEDGTRLVPFVNETDFGEYAVDLGVSRQRRRAAKDSA